jgi:aspartate carbamoyltransferase catalytic subunit
MPHTNHLIRTDDFSKEEIESLLDDAKRFSEAGFDRILKDKLIITLFFENSTRTRSSFEVAAKRLGAEVVHLDVAKSSTKKGETLVDTAMNLDAMNPDAIIVRHKDAGVPKILSKHTNASIVNAGDGAHAHPSQALLDLYNEGVISKEQALENASSASDLALKMSGLTSGEMQADPNEEIHSVEISPEDADVFQLK